VWMLGKSDSVPALLACQVACNHQSPDAASFGGERGAAMLEALYACVMQPLTSEGLWKRLLHRRA
jgi:hypothetical protein